MLKGTVVPRNACVSSNHAVFCSLRCTVPVHVKRSVVSKADRLNGLKIRKKRNEASGGVGDGGESVKKAVNMTEEKRGENVRVR